MSHVKIGLLYKAHFGDKLWNVDSDFRKLTAVREKS